MRLIVLLIAVALVGLLVARQLRTPLEVQSTAPATTGSDQSTVSLPRVPQQPQGIKQFGKDLNSFVSAAAQQQKQAIDAATQ